MLNPKEVILSIASVILGAGLVFITTNPRLHSSSKWQSERTAIARIPFSSPQNALRDQKETEFITKFALSDSTSPDEFKSFLIELDQIKLSHVNANIQSLVTFHDLSVAGLNQKTDQSIIALLKMELSQSSEMAVIQTQLLQREISALKFWKPGATAEQCLANADAQVHR